MCVKIEACVAEQINSPYNHDQSLRKTITTKLTKKTSRESISFTYFKYDPSKHGLNHENHGNAAHNRRRAGSTRKSSE